MVSRIRGNQNLNPAEAKTLIRKGNRTPIGEPSSNRKFLVTGLVIGFASLAAAFASWTVGLDARDEARQAMSPVFEPKASKSLEGGQAIVFVNSGPRVKNISYEQIPFVRSTVSHQTCELAGAWEAGDGLNSELQVLLDQDLLENALNRFCCESHYEADDISGAATELFMAELHEKWTIHLLVKFSFINHLGEPKSQHYVIDFETGKAEFYDTFEFDHTIAWSDWNQDVRVPGFGCSDLNDHLTDLLSVSTTRP
ncbi:MAG: hypothetical protein AAGG48_01510 [Planctomycetota bacterium]